MTDLVKTAVPLEGPERQRLIDISDKLKESNNCLLLDTIKKVLECAAFVDATKSADARPVAIYLGRIETSDGNEAWVELADEDRKYWRDTVRSVHATRDAASIEFPYQKTFDAIAAATSVCGGNIAVSVGKFVESFNAAPAGSASRVLTDDVIWNIGAMNGMARLAELLDDDQWNEVEPLLLKFALALLAVSTSVKPS